MGDQDGGAIVNLALTHRRLTVLMSLASLLAFSGSAGVEPLAAALAGAGLTLALFWHPGPALSARVERFFIPLALLLAVRALIHVFIIHDDVVVPVVDLLFLLLTVEALRSLDARNDVRLYSLSFALLLAATAYRPGVLFLIAFLIYVVLGTQALMLGFLRREAIRHRAKNLSMPRAFLLTSVGLSAITLSVAAIVFLTFPRVSRGWSGRGESAVSSIAGFADEVTLGSHGGRIFGNPRIVLRVEFPGGASDVSRGLYWRGRSYDHFDGLRWSRSSRLPPSQAPPSWYRRWGSDTILQRMYAAPLDTRVLFALHPTLEIRGESGIQPISTNGGDHTYWGFGPPGYSAVSLRDRPEPAELRAAQGEFVPARTYYTQLPPLAPEVLELSDSLLAELPTTYDRATTLVRWFREEFAYTLDLPRTVRESTVDHFLLQRRAGHCEYFSTAMVLLLRSQGIPAREVNGFLGGTWSDLGNYLAVTQNDAHAWVEVWFSGYGWVPFDPTPPGRGAAGVGASWFWPGRFLLDALQHRWNKWVLDYSFQSQFSLLEKGRNVLTEPRGTDAGSSGASRRWNLPLLLTSILVGAALLWGFGRALRRSGAYSQESRIFLDLRTACRKSGVPNRALRSPGRLTTYLEEAGHPAAPGVSEVVEGYLKARFSGQPLNGAEETRLKTTLKEVRRQLKRARSP